MGQWKHKMREREKRKKKKGTTKYDKRTVTCDVSTAQCEDGNIKYEEKIREPPNVAKIQSDVTLVLHNVTMIPSNMGKNKGTTECDKSIVTCDVDTT